MAERPRITGLGRGEMVKSRRTEMRRIVCRSRVTLPILLLVLLACARPAYRNPNLPAELRVADLLKRMTLEEKIALLGGTGYDTTPIERLGVPALRMTDGPLGPNRKGRGTNFSATIAMAATFDDSLVRRVGEAIGRETYTLGFDILLAPCINIARVPHGGRTFEGFGEDPYLVKRMAVAYIRGVQSQKVLCCTKHFAANNQEWNRFDVDARVDERALREIYFPAFKAAVDAGTGAIMTAYNRLNGFYCSENKYLLTDVLKGEWGFRGIVMSDWGAVHSTVPTALAGLDLEMPTGKYFGELGRAVREGQVPIQVIDDKVSRILSAIIRLGLLDREHPEGDTTTVDTTGHAALALEVARKAIVLLKNEGNFLPLDPTRIRSLAVIGPNGNVARLYGGGSGVQRPFYAISPLEGIRRRLGEAVDVRFAPGVVFKRKELPTVPASWLIPARGGPGQHGLLGEYFADRDLRGQPVVTRVDSVIDFDWHDRAPAPGVPDDSFSVRWTGKLVPQESGTFEFGARTDNGCRLYLNGKLLIDWWKDSAPNQTKSVYVALERGREYDLRLEMYENQGWATAHLGIAPARIEGALEEAVALARSSDVVVLCVGLWEDLEGEAHDRENLELPEDQVKLIRAVTEANRHTVVVLNNATPVLMTGWIERVPAILEAWYPGQEGGRALAEILFGDVNPSGKLPLTFPKRWEDSPVYGTYPGVREYAEYAEGIFVGYRGFDARGVEPLFPFGHGLSYTSFRYSDLELTPLEAGPGDTVRVRFSITNVGNRAGSEVAQLYVRDVEASVPRPPKELKGFCRVSLLPGETARVTLALPIAELAFYDVERRKWVVEPGRFEVLVGASSRDIRLRQSFEVVM
jgi:beta-glucosidase